jgi:hypothetical protein
MNYVNDSDVWGSVPLEWRWIYDKLVVAGYESVLAGPAGISVPRAGWYIVRPITNIRMMSRGASTVWLEPGDDYNVPDGYFWSEVLTGDHISVDYLWGTPVLAVQGYRDDPSRLDRFSRWVKLPAPKIYPIPSWLESFALVHPWVNVEYIGGKAIEVHCRYNDDFSNHTSNEIVPRWKGDDLEPPEGWDWYPSPSADRVGFWIKKG